MDTAKYLEFHKEKCDKARAISEKKNQDYSAPDARKGDPFAVFGNFMQAERLNICTVEQGFMVRISDKLSRLSNLLAPGHQQAVMDEGIEDTALDTINYLLLLLGYREAKREVEADREHRVKEAVKGSAYATPDYDPFGVAKEVSPRAGLAPDSAPTKAFLGLLYDDISAKATRVRRLLESGKYRLLPVPSDKFRCTRFLLAAEGTAAEEHVHDPRDRLWHVTSLSTGPFDVLVPGAVSAGSERDDP